MNLNTVKWANKGVTVNSFSLVKNKPNFMLWELAHAVAAANAKDDLSLKMKNDFLDFTR